MIPSRLSLFLKQFYKGSKCNYRFCSVVSQAADDKDPALLFFNENVQKLLKTLTRINYDKVFRRRKDGTPLSRPIYKFMTEDELQRALSNIENVSWKRIQMPPVVKVRDDTTQVLSKDSAMQGFSDVNYVITDISFGNTNRNRIITVRETNGTLRHAYSKERHRINQVYFPIEGRALHIPRMFSEPFFTELLKKEEFEFILDRLCLQFEPDDPEYHKITKQVYSYVNESRKFDRLRSTRHFGPLAFHLAWECNIDNLLENILDNNMIDEAVALVKLYHQLHPEAQSAKEPECNDVELITNYVKMDSLQQEKILPTLNRYKKLQEEKQEIQKNIMKAHGFIKDKPET